MKILVPARLADAINRTGNIRVGVYVRKLPTTGSDYDRLRRAVRKRRRRLLRNQDVRP